MRALLCNEATLSNPTVNCNIVSTDIDGRLLFNDVRIELDHGHLASFAERTSDD